MPQGEGGILMTLTQEHGGCHVLPTEVEAGYKRRLHELDARLFSSQRHRYMVLFVLAAFTVLLILSLMGDWHFSVSALAVVPVIGIIFGVREYVRYCALSRQLAHRCMFYERGLDRLRGEWRELEETKARQEAVRELRGATALREEISLLGKYQFQGCNAAALHHWLNTPELRVHPTIPIFLFACGSAILLLAILCLAQFVSWMQILPILVPLVLAQAAVSAPLSREIRSRLRVLRSLKNEFSVLQQGLRLLQRQSFTSSKLKGLVNQSREANASLQIRKLEHLLSGVVQREKEILALPSLLTAAGTQLVLAVERWREANKIG